MKIQRSQFKRFIYAAFGFSLVLLFLVGYFSYRATGENEENLARVLHTHEVLTEGEKLYTELKDAQRSQRGYLLTENQVYLNHFSASKDSVFALIPKLQRVTADQPIQQIRLDELTSIVNETFAYWEKTISLNQSRKRDNAFALVKEGVGFRLAERIGKLILEFKKHEQMLLAQRQADYLNSRRSRNLLAVGGGILAILLLSLSFIALRKLLEREQQLTNTLDQKVKERTRKLNKSLESLTKTNEELDSFVYTASHDLRTPIVNLMGLTQILKKSFNGNLSTKQEEFLRLMDASVERLDRTVKQLADIAKISREDLSIETVSFSTIFKDVLEDIAPLIEKTNAQIITDFEVSEISYPYAHLKSVLYNLVSNAIKYHAPDRRPVVKIATFHEQERTCLTVEDNGLGLSPKQLDKLFTMYKRLHDHVEGSGVGLTIVKRIIENHGGRIMVSSKLHEGSTFTMVLGPHS